MAKKAARIRGALNVGLSSAGLEIHRKPPLLVRTEHNLTIDLEYAAAHLVAFHPGRQISAVQVGAFDGVSNDPLAPLLQAFHWSAVLIEPQPCPFAALRHHYADNQAVQVFNVAIGERDSKRMLYMLKSSDPLPDIFHQVASFDRAHVEKIRRQELPHTATEITAVEVETWTFNTLLRRSNTTLVDVLQIDAEGYDFELLKLFDVPRRLPTIVHYEHQHLSRSDRNAAAELLVACGYRLAMSFTSPGDTLAVRRE